MLMAATMTKKSCCWYCYYGRRLLLLAGGRNQVNGRKQNHAYFWKVRPKRHAKTLEEDEDEGCW